MAALTLTSQGFLEPAALEKLRADFPILHQNVHNKPLVYLDNAATTQKPLAVIAAEDHYYRFDNANVHRAAHALSDRATQAFENARIAVAQYIHSAKPEQVIWTRGTTESINLVAHSWGRSQLKAGDEIIVSAMEHHANIVPWQMLCEITGAILKVIPVSADGELDMVAFDQLLTERTKLVSVVHVSNALGTVNPIKQIVDKAHAAGALALIDGAQAMPHWTVDVQALDCDFYAFSGHKMFGPTGVGVLYGKEALLNAMPPYQGGGEMISKVTFAKTTYNELPYKFEAGTPHIAGVIGLGAAVEYLNGLDRSILAKHEDALLAYAHAQADEFDGLTRIGKAKHKAGVMSFLLNGAHPHDVGTLLDQQGVAVRTGHHCAMPIM
ncbi:MAG TPA: SufS family cysteine desulfurase, partial [Pseudomonadales bacterium]|nr:SufS family cysteine desulfurase [Pseudomonadales bacterium]